MNTEPYKLTIQGTNLFKNALIPQRNKFIFEQVEAAAVRMGQQNFTKAVMDIANMDFKMICESRMDYYSLEEISNVLQLGALGELGDAIGMSSRTLASWVKNYQEKYRKLIARHYEENDVIALPESTQKNEYTRQDAIKHLREVYEDANNGEMILAWSYDIAMRFDLIPEKHRDLHKTEARAKAEVHEEQMKHMTKGALSRDQFMRIIKDKSEGSPLEQAMKRQALRDWFSWMKLGKGFNIE